MCEMCENGPPTVWEKLTAAEARAERAEAAGIEKDRIIASAVGIAQGCIDYMEHHASNTSEEETALVVRWLAFHAQHAAPKEGGT